MNPSVYYLCAFLLLLAAAFSLVVHLARERRGRLAALAEELGWRFNPDFEHGKDGVYRGFWLFPDHCFTQPYTHGAYNTLSGRIRLVDSQGREVEVDAQTGDFSGFFKNQVGKGVSCLSYLVVRLPFATEVDLQINSRDWVQKAKGTRRADEVVFDREELGYQLSICGGAEPLVRAVMHDEMQDFLSAFPPPGLIVSEGQLFLSDCRTRWEPDDFRRWIAWTEQFVGLLPRHLEPEAVLS